MYFTALVEMSNRRDLDEVLFGEFEYLVIVNLQTIRSKIDDDSWESFGFEARNSNRILYLVDALRSAEIVDFVRFLEDKVGKVIEGVEWDRPVLVKVRTADILDGSPSFVDSFVEYVDDHLDPKETSNEEDMWLYRQSPWGYALVSAHRSLMGKEKHRVTFRSVDLFRIISALWRAMAISGGPT